jgi:ectoine hydroxylase-related dioxygenase (phytanoyl-CoA dioxygenase family)
MQPRRYHPQLRGDVYEQRAAGVAAQLLGQDLELDYDQLVAKPPRQESAVFHWHQDLAYWPPTTDPRTASFWLALDDVRADNGRVEFVRGSHREPGLRPHRPMLADRGKSHTLVADVDVARDVVEGADLRPGDVTVHHERTVHGSAGNRSDRWRRGWVLAFRSRTAVAEERALGFTHSHNDDPELLARLGAQAARAGQ